MSNDHRRDREAAIRSALDKLLLIGAEFTTRTAEAREELDFRISCLTSSLTAYEEGDEENGLLHLIRAMDGFDQRYEKM